MTILNFHVRHEVNPDRVWKMLDAQVRSRDYDHITQYDRQLSRMRQLGLVSYKGAAPTPAGLELHRIGMKRREVVWDLLHYLHYTRWRAADPTSNTLFFTYQAYCDLLATKRDVDLASQRSILAAEMTSLIATSAYFIDETTKLAKGAVSLSTNSLIGVEHWLAKLAPAVITPAGAFTLRHYCSPELLLMALGYVTAISGSHLGVDQPLTATWREAVCRICLIETEVLDQLIDWLIPEYPAVIQHGTTTGSYGRFVRVLRLPTLKDVLP